MTPLSRPPFGVTGCLMLLIVATACGGDGTGPEQKEETPPTRTRVEVAIDLDGGRAPISPLIYGSNQDDGRSVWTVRRYGGNRLTGYNWENNYSSAGSDWFHSSDNFMISNAGLASSEAFVPARAMTHFHDQSVAMGAQSIVTLQMAGYVAADDRGTVPQSETAPSARWVRVAPRKGAPFTTTPSLTDGVVYMDELANLLVQKYGPASSATGVKWYSLDNEPALWSSTHPRIHPDKVGAAELVSRSVALSGAVKAVDPGAQVTGPALYGIGAYVSLQDAPDWLQVRGGREWFIDYYLDRMRQASDSAGRRLLDALDVHWYPEARGDHRITDGDAITTKDMVARLQAPRTLWDSTYTEDSWVAQYLRGFLPILPKLRRSVDERYPGTKLAITEYTFGGGASVSGGMAQADLLGAFGRHGVDVATIWGIGPSDVYTAAGFKLYRDYDGRGGSFGATSVAARTVSVADRAKVSAWASIAGPQDASVLHVILLNKEQAETIVVRLSLAGAGGGASYTSGEAWGFGAGGAQITRRPDPGPVTNNVLEYPVPPMTAVHLVLRR